MFSAKLLDHFENPRNVGKLDPPAVRAEASNPICGDILHLSAVVSNGVLEEVLYQTRGCTASIAVGSALTELLRGRTLELAEQLSTLEIEAAVDGLPNESKHAAVLALDAARALARAAKSAS